MKRRVVASKRARQIGKRRWQLETAVDACKAIAAVWPGPVRAALLGLVVALWAPVTHAGLTVDDALTRAHQLDGSDGWSELIPAVPQQGLTIAIGGPRQHTPQIAVGQGRGDVSVSAAFEAATAGRLSVRAGIAWREGWSRPWSFEGSAVTFALTDRAGKTNELYASVERRHWGPGWAGSLIMDSAAPAIPALGWRREVAQSESPWLAWLGPWGADFFIGGLQGHTQPARPYLVGMRIELQPTDRLQIGLSRTMQWGGQGRDESLRTWLRALFGTDNIGNDGVTPANEPGNQLAGVDWRWVIGQQRPLSIYGQVVGEDEAGHLPSRNMVLLGADARVPVSPGSLRVFLEWANTLAGDISGDPRPGASYRHHIYRQGYTQDGVLLGHPAGGDVQIASIGAVIERGPAAALFAFSAGRAEPTAQLFAPGRVLGITATAHADIAADQRVGAGFWWWRDTLDQRTSAQVWWQYRWR
jgi:Capsule assembly protein Wzi